MLKSGTLRYLGCAFGQRLQEKSREYDRLKKDSRGKPQWVGREAQTLWIEKDLPSFALSTLLSTTP